MKEFNEQLFQAFCHECRRRMQYAIETLDNNKDQTATAETYDKLHQEFDSLVGAARAVNLEKVERFNRSMASLSRYLRNKLPEQANNEEASLLREGIAFSMECGCESERCIVMQTERIETTISRVNTIVNK